MAEIVYVPVSGLCHIEGYSLKRVEWLRLKILRDAVWTRPLALEQSNHLVLDGQHRMEVARQLGLVRVPAVLFEYSTVPIRSLRKQYCFDWREVMTRALKGDPYPYKTVKHDFPDPLPVCTIPLAALAVAS